LVDTDTPDPMQAARLLREYGVRPSRRLGQSFLTDPAALEKVVRAAGLQNDDVVLEVGAGLGVLTRRLASMAGRVVAVEFDRKLIPILETTLAGLANVDLVPGDIMRLDLEGLMGKLPYLVVANIPYYLTSALIRRLLESPQPPRRLVLLVQKEGGARVVSRPGEMSLLALSVQLYGEPRIEGRVPAGAFYPRPDVDSVVLRVDLHPAPKVRRDLIDPLFRLAKAAFGQRRKTLRNSLAGGLGLPASRVSELLERAGVSARVRAQEVSLPEWERLAEAACYLGLSSQDSGRGDQI